MNLPHQLITEALHTATHKNGFRKETMKFQTFSLNGYLAWMLADVQTNHGRSFAHVQWFSH